MGLLICVYLRARYGFTCFSRIILYGFLVRLKGVGIIKRHGSEMRDIYDFT